MFALPLCLLRHTSKTCVPVLSTAACQAEGLHLLMDLAQLTTLSFGEHTLSFERWQHVKAMELARMARLPRPVIPVPQSPVSVSAV